MLRLYYTACLVTKYLYCVIFTVRSQIKLYVCVQLKCSISYRRKTKLNTTQHTRTSCICCQNNFWQNRILRAKYTSTCAASNPHLPPHKKKHVAGKKSPAPIFTKSKRQTNRCKRTSPRVLPSASDTHLSPRSSSVGRLLLRWNMPVTLPVPPNI